MSQTSFAADVKMFTTQTCPYCVRAKHLLNKKGVPFQEIDVSYDQAKRVELVKTTGRTTVPQIFINGTSIGGSDELHALERAGKLDEMLAAAPA